MSDPLPTLRLTRAGRTSVGQRANNEDSHLYDAGGPPEVGAVVVVADGMGGHAAGEVASRIAVETVLARYLADPAPDRKEALARAVAAANTAILDRARETPALRGMGTTCTAAVLRGREAVVAHVGDSRAYLVRDEVAHRLTRDHSVDAELGGGDGTGAHSHMLTRALGTDPGVRVDVSADPVALRIGDRLLLCSDGLTRTVSDEDLGRIAWRNDPDAAGDILVAMALEAGGTDNVTVEIVRVDAVEETPGSGFPGRFRRPGGGGRPV